ncbi:histidinol-phosphate transaminase [Oxalobacter paraformigenes]|uniref:Histidinol-phosphate aminotransferase n=1 Tax=Oxalobacter paraformigenes TaxID=556268 RepID=C3X757_9BURK|nr:histidinol-phosphate transaminase [Oxalobacter paraformigenes]EEO28951.1 histidinol-phosphate transaminase [Oxalobacter paraformigenes]
MSNQFAPEYIRAIAPYQAGKPISEVAREFGLDPQKIVKLASNENPCGMPPSAKQAVQHVLDETGRYPDANGFELKKVLSERYDVPQSWITLGNGSNDILDLAARTFVQAGQSILFSEYSFLVYALVAKAIGAKGIQVPSVNFGHDLMAMLKAVRDDTRLIFIANPNNPTGTFLQPVDIETFLDKVPSNVVVVIDEAYNEYLDSSIQYDSTAWVKKYPNLLVSRTFSKAYGLAGLRVGFGLAQPELTDLLNRVRQPFNVNALAQAAAVAALNDKTFLEKSARINADGYRYLTGAFEEMGLEYVPSHGNFVLVRVGNDDGAGTRVNLELLKKGIIVRPVNAYGLPKWLRVSIGLPEENRAFVKALKEIMA